MNKEKIMKETANWLQPKQQVDNAAGAEHLREILRFHEHKYYVLSEPLITDAEYDILYKKLEHAEAAHAEWITADSPTQRVGGKLNQGFATVDHLVPMLSLENSYDAEDLRAWDKKVREMAGSETVTYSVEPKYDGASISCIYENDLLQRTATRGNGVQGDDITTNSKRMRSLPLRAAFSRYGIALAEIRGEVLISKNSFAQLNALLEEEGAPPLANARNAASGTLRVKDPKEVEKRKLEAYAYHLSYLQPLAGWKGADLQKHSEVVDMLAELGFKSPQGLEALCQTIDEVIATCNRFEEQRDDLPYEIDGMVIKVDSLALQERLGMTTHHPRWAMAYKFKARQAQSILTGVEFQVGRTGAVTPVGKVQPVGIGGVTVTSISLHNEDYILEKDLLLGDQVIIERAGDVIPQIVRSLPEMRKGGEKKIVFPTECPECRQELFREEGEAVWRCVNAECPAQAVERIIHFVSKDAMDIKSFGEQQVRKFYELKMLKDVPGIYQFDFSRLEGLEGYKQRSIEKLKEAVEASKKQPLHRIIYGLGIRHVGETMAKGLARKVKHLPELQHWTPEQLQQTEDVGPKVAASIHQFFTNDANLKMLEQLELLGLNLKSSNSSQRDESGELAGKTFLFTGTLPTLKRSEAEALAESKGGQILSGVSSKLNYLIVGEDAGSKLEKARKITSITILSEDEFLKMVQR